MPDFAKLLAGYGRFRTEGWPRERARWERLADGQKPGVMVIACSDSRVDPSHIFDASPGEMFVVRNVAALVPPFETAGGFHGVSAALEFAVTQLQVSQIVVLGHGGCGGCAAALTGKFSGAADGEGGFIARWISMLDDARTRVCVDYGGDVDERAFAAMEHEAVKISLANLRTFPWVRDREADGSLRLQGAWFAIKEGNLEVLDQSTGFFAEAPVRPGPAGFR
ncbi:MAG TPA: carbonic anhydrase [Sphingomonadaceae bacterium]|nr:carbonic anhydrase [Sphingomonadaceae bacterium]